MEHLIIQNDTSNPKEEMFRFNPGIQQQTFPDYNAYTIRRCNDCDIASPASDSSPVGSTLAYAAESDLCQACQLLHKCEAQRYNTVKEYENGGKVSVHQLVNTKDSDYDKLIGIANFFAREFGEDVKLTPKMSRPPKFVYQNIYGSLMGTAYEGKCPDLLVENKWYEHEGYMTKNPKRAFMNMMSHGFKQCSRLIIDKPNLTDAYMKRVFLPKRTKKTV